MTPLEVPSVLTRTIRGPHFTQELNEGIMLAMLLASLKANENENANYNIEVDEYVCDALL